MSVLLVLVHGYLHGDWLQALLAGIALAMAMLPEAYPVVLAVFPALGAWRLSKQKVLTRRVDAIGLSIPGNSPSTSSRHAGQCGLARPHVSLS
jgi:magnesium-transporting ATPase (P-type)